MRYQQKSRRAATTVEAAAVYPIVFLFTIGFVVGVMGVFRYQEVATLSREACRYAAVHGTNYAKDAGVAAPSTTDIYNTVIVPRAVTLDTTRLNYAITYNTTNAPYHTVITNGEANYVYNTVTVVVTYQWIPEVYLGGVTLSSSSSMHMCY